MYADALGDSLTFQLRNIAFLRFEQDSGYQNVISPFTRLYLVTEGSGSLAVANERISLEAGCLYLIPSFTPCSYIFGEGLGHYYIHFTSSCQNGINVYSIFDIRMKVKACDLDKSLFARLLEINQGMELPHRDPKVYQKKPWVNRKVVYQSVCQHLETNGIIGQLFSRFLVPGQKNPANSILRYNIQPILIHIQDNLSNEMTVQGLADQACFSTDHFTRIFKSLLGMPPGEYVIRKRIEKAQLLLLTTDLPHNRIMEETGFRNASYFSRLFKKYTSYSPAVYRKQRG
jgi:AraC family transcriptional regulator